MIYIPDMALSRENENVIIFYPTGARRQWGEVPKWVSKEIMICPLEAEIHKNKSIHWKLTLFITFGIIPKDRLREGYKNTVHNNEEICH